MLLLLIGITVALVTPLNAQKKPQVTRKSTPKLVLITIEGTTKDGRPILLKSDGTWQYAETASNQPVENTTDPSSSPLPSQPIRQNLNLEAALVFRSGDVRPMARTTFYLLDQDLITILRAAGITSNTRFSSGNADKDLISDVGFAYTPQYSGLPEQAALRVRVEEAIKSHIVQQITTDFGGKGEFTGLDGNVYYLFGVGATPKGFALWSMPINTHETNSIVLDQNNMSAGI